MAELAYTYASVEGVELDGRALRVERAKVSRTLFVAKIQRSLSNQVRNCSLRSL
jgi:hypothetical protein